MIVAEITTYGGPSFAVEATFDVGDIVHIALVVDRENGPELYINGNRQAPSPRTLARWLAILARSL